MALINFSIRLFIVNRRSLEMRVRATDPRPCPKCGKIYRSAHTLRTHLEDKHTVCPGYRCVLCGTVAKSRNSLHSHMSRQHRGISTKDLPVLPMPSAFDPELASRLLAKAGVKISPAELRARASPTNSGGGNGGGSQTKIDINLTNSMKDEVEDSDDDPEDLTTASGGYGSVGGTNDLSRYHESLLSNFGHANTTISRIRNEAAAAAAAAALGQQKDLSAGQIPTSTAAGQSLLDTYLQFITENTFGKLCLSVLIFGAINTNTTFPIFHHRHGYVTRTCCCCRLACRQNGPIECHGSWFG